jgi:hypothetical protein
MNQTISFFILHPSSFQLEALVRAPLLSALTFSLFLTGCQKTATPLPGPVPVKGRVQTTDGKPVKQVVLVFHAQDDATKGQVQSAVTDGKDGTFSLSCIPGSYRVAVAPLSRHGHADPAAGKAEAPDKVEARGKEQAGTEIPRQYQSAETTPWTVQVFESGRDDVVLTLKK